MSIAQTLLFTLASLGLAACSSPSSSSVKPDALEQYEIQVQVYEMPRAVSDELLGPNSGGCKIYPESVLNRVDAAATLRDDVTKVSRPRLVVESGASASISTMSKIEYVQDYAVNAAGKSEPVKSNVEEGLSLKFRVEREAQGLGLESTIGDSKLFRPMRDADITLANGEKVHIQLPEVSKREMRGKLVLGQQEGFAASLWSGERADHPSDRVTVVLGTVREHVR